LGDRSLHFAVVHKSTWKHTVITRISHREWPVLRRRTLRIRCTRIAGTADSSDRSGPRSCHSGTLIRSRETDVRSECNAPTCSIVSTANHCVNSLRVVRPSGSAHHRLRWALQPCLVPMDDLPPLSRKYPNIRKL